jgi:hypothetical protein
MVRRSENRSSSGSKLFCLAAAFALVIVCALDAVAGQPVGPPGDYQLDPEYTVKSPDGATAVEQYATTNADGNYAWQFWARRNDKLSFLGPEQQDYAASFRFTNDSRFLVRMQKIGSGEAELYLYNLDSRTKCNRAMRTGFARLCQAP